MPFEVECGFCHERFQPAQESGVVACPHCETKVQLPARPADETEAGPRNAIDDADAHSHIHADAGPESTFPGLPEDGPVSDVALPVFDDRESTAAEGSGLSAIAVMQGFPDADPEPAPDSGLHRFIGETGPEVDDDDEADDFQIETGSGPLHPAEAEPGNVDVNANRPVSESSVSKPSGAPQSAERSVPPAAEAFDRQSESPSSRGAGGPGVSRFLFMMLVGYAAAVTVALVWLWMTRGRVHPLESLPDVEPNPQGYIVPEDADLPPGHVLKFGETRRYGSLEVTPLKVTRGDEHEPVWKLWLRIRNVSDDQSFRPFGWKLLTMKGRSKNRDEPGANTFVCRVDEKKPTGRRVFVLQDHDDLEADRLELDGQQVDRTLGPDEEYTTFIATTSYGLEDLQGDLVWRVHFRKGLHPATRRGVTTLIEVPFHSDDVQSESRTARRETRNPKPLVDSFPGSGLGTHSREALLRNALTGRLAWNLIPTTNTGCRIVDSVVDGLRIARNSTRCQAEPGDKCVPKPRSLGTREVESLQQGFEIRIWNFLRISDFEFRIS